MAGPIKGSALPIRTAAANTDRIVVVANTSGNGAVLATVNVSDVLSTAIISSITNVVGGYTASLDANGTFHIPAQIGINPTLGPYANDTAAALAGIALHTLYYDSTGTVKIRLV